MTMTPTQPDLWQAVVDNAIGRADDHADEAWKAAALGVVAAVAQLHDDFTTDEVWAALDVMPVSTHERAAMGGVITKAVKAGLIEKAGFRRNSRLSHRHRELTVWRRTTDNNEEASCR